ncbi:MAG: prephenate dehydratase [Thermoflexus sp.]|uniref:prephenate dehydratase n=1 Tax=Thermoflexus sp. TaxID=1969742 RepID=UPI0025D3DD40|nr:prephenate dehydratase [Thermoflexus sp.]MCS6964889.1 prephenate dehydratase [Thermoflexus sp.]MCS7351667.1 prephenate dehydratase [Thermoflexus sp.]MDW8181125.1 prephenate dehydratase [Anaerolineae bacterium]MDW8184351.1 prephenate dehydratase [Anaerolineae bacterium]
MLYGLRGAVTAEANTPEAIASATRRLLESIIRANRLAPEEIVAAWFTTTPDLTAAFPASAAREIGWTHVPMLCAQEIPVPHTLPRCIRVLLLVQPQRPFRPVPIYLGEAQQLRPDLFNGPGDPPLAEETDPSERIPVRPRVAFQGEPGAYSHEAALGFFGSDLELLPCRTFAEVAQAVEAGRAEFGILPIENSTAGSINAVYDLLLDRDLRIWGEVILPVRHCLLAPPGTLLSDIRVVRSHPQALEQCARFIERHGWEALAAHDTAGSARMLAERPEPGIAAIASRLAAERYGLVILAEGIEDDPENATRFFIVSTREPARAERNKTSIVFSTRHVPGALHACLGEFAARGINLTKLESRPRRGRPWEYVFYVDFEGHWQDPPCREALLGLLQRASFLKLLGSYPAAEGKVQVSVEKGAER